MLTSLSALGYEVVDNPIQGTSYFDDQQDGLVPSQSWVITLKHRGSIVTESVVATNTIHYLGTDTTRPDYTEQVVVTLTHMVDMVTGSDVSEEAGSAYTNCHAPTYEVTLGKALAKVDDAGHIAFATVATPPLAGYTCIPTEVTGHATFDQPGAITNVMYHAVQQLARVIFKDDTMGGGTLTRVDLGGYTGQRIDFADAQDVLQQYLDAGYQLVEKAADSHLIESTQNYTTDEKDTQLFFVHLEHKVVAQSHDVPVSMTVTYTGAGAKTPATQTDSAVVTMTESVDAVTSQVITSADAASYGSAFVAPTYVAKIANVTVDGTGNVTFKSVQTPTVKGYTADEAVVTPTATVMHPTFTITVHYTADAQQAAVVFKDVDADNAVVAQTSMAGVTDATMDFTTATHVKESLLAAGYEVVADGEPSQATYDNADDVNQTYVVTLRHHLNHVSDSEVVTNTVHFVGPVAKRQVMLCKQPR